MKLILCINDSAISADMLTFGQSLSRHLRLPTHLLGIASSPSQIPSLRARLASVQTALQADGLTATLQVESGPLEPTIREVASAESASLIVLGPLGRTRLARHLLGPRALDVLQHGQSSVLFVPPRARITIRRILLAIGGLGYSGTAVEMAARMARSHGAAITLLHVVQGESRLPETLREPHTIEEFLASDTVQARHVRQVLALLREQGIDVEPRLRRGRPLRQLLLEIQESAYDLVVLGSHHSASALTEITGGIAPSLMRRAGIPVLVSRPPNR